MTEQTPGWRPDAVYGDYEPQYPDAPHTEAPTPCPECGNFGHPGIVGPCPFAPRTEAVCAHPGCGLPERLHGTPPGEKPNPTRSTHRFAPRTEAPFDPLTQTLGLPADGNNAPRTEAPDPYRLEDLFTTQLQETGRLTVHPGDEVAAIAAVRNISAEPFTISLSATPAPERLDVAGALLSLARANRVYRDGKVTLDADIFDDALAAAVDRLGFTDLLDIADALLVVYPPETIVCTHRESGDIGARTVASIADLVASCRARLRESGS